jgi:hypothetical protein
MRPCPDRPPLHEGLPGRQSLELVLPVGTPPFTTTSTNSAVVITIAHSPRHLHEVSHRRSLQEDPSHAGHHKTGHEEAPAREEEVQPCHQNTGGDRSYGDHRGGQPRRHNARRLLLEPHSHGLGKVAATLRLKGGLCHEL